MTGERPESLQFGHYQVIGELGRGGMGVVYKARDPHLQRLVAIKTLPPEQSLGESRRQRLLQEARAASALNHPNIVTVYDISRDSRQDFIVMEYLEGESLNDLLALGKLKRSQALGIARQVGSALAVAHEAGITHRDLKPGNIFVCQDGTIKVLDFGLAKLARAPEEPGSQAETLTAPLTRIGTVLGTPHYMSPEQAQGREVDFRSDIFSFGVVLYELFAGCRPFQGTEPTAVLHEVIYSQPSAPRRLNPELSVALEAVILRAMEKEPNARQSSVRALLEQLESASRNSWSAIYGARLYSAKRRLSEVVRSGRAPALAVAALLSGMLSYQLLDWIPQAWSGGPPTDIQALSPLQVMDQAARLLYRWDLEGNVDRAIESFEELLSGGIRSAAVMAGVSEAFFRKYQATRDESWLERSLRAAEEAAELDPHFSNAQIRIAAVFKEQGRLNEAKEILESVVQTDPLNSEAWIWLGNTRSSLKLESEAMVAYQSAISSDPDNWEARILMGSLLWDSSEASYQDALQQYVKAAQIVPDSPVAHQHTGAAYHMLGDFGEAVREFQKALRVQPSAAIYSNLGTAYYFQGLYREAAAAFEQAVQMGPGVYSRWANWADALRRLPGKAAAATRAYRRAVELLELEMESGRQSPELKTRMALYQAKAGDTDRAIAVLAEVGEAGLSGQPSWLFRALLAYELAGDRKKALEMLEVALRAGYSRKEIQKEPELSALRQDYRYHEILLGAEENEPSAPK